MLFELAQGAAQQARNVNRRLRHGYPAGYALDATHAPHLTLVQCYVARTDLPRVFAAIAPILDRPESRRANLLATGYASGGAREPTTVVLSVQRTPRLQRLQRELLDALRPLRVTGADANAFVRTPVSEKIAASTMTYVKTFAQQRTGQRFDPHVTLGQATLDDARALKEAPFTARELEVSGFAVHQLGNHGTARRRLWPLE